ncbi:MAG: hypothetical protein ACPGSD_05680 [Flavobacteriales bacterium]
MKHLAIIIYLTFILFNLYSCQEVKENFQSINTVHQVEDSIAVKIDITLTKDQLKESILKQVEKLNCNDNGHCSFVGQLNISEKEYVYFPYYARHLLGPKRPPGTKCLFFDHINVQLKKDSLFLNEDYISITQLDSVLKSDSKYFFPLEMPNKIRVLWNDDTELKLKQQTFRVLFENLNEIYDRISDTRFGKSVKKLTENELIEFRDEIAERQILYKSFRRKMFTFPHSKPDSINEIFH